MKVICEMNIGDFQAWSGGRDTLNRVIDEGKEDVLESILDDMYPDGLTDTELNDLLWFDSDQVYEWCDIKTYDQINEAIDQLETWIREEEIEMMNDIRWACEAYAHKKDVRRKAADMQRRKHAEKIADMKEQIEELENELKYAV